MAEKEHFFAVYRKDGGRFYFLGILKGTADAADAYFSKRGGIEVAGPYEDLDNVKQSLVRISHPEDVRRHMDFFYDDPIVKEEIALTRNNAHEAATEQDKRLVVEAVTPSGNITAEEVKDDEYPGIRVAIDGQTACVVEWDLFAKKIMIRAYQEHSDKPIATIAYDTGGEK